MLNTDGDLGRHITIGNYILKNLEIPVRDIFSHTMTGQPIIPHEWLAEVFFSAANALIGLPGVVFLTSVIIATTFTLMYREMLRQNIYRILAFAFTILAAFASSIHWLTRPHIFTFLFTALWAYLLENEKSKVWIFPLIMLVWANTHGAFIAGFVILAGHLAGWLWEYIHKNATREKGVKFVIIGISSFAVTFINPAGWRLWDTSVGYLGIRFLVDHTVEYQSPNFHDPVTWPFLLLLVLGILALGFGGRMRAHQAILFAGWSVMSLYSARNIPLFAIVTTPYIGCACQMLLANSNVFTKIEERLSGTEKNLKGSLFFILASLLLTFAFLPRIGTVDQFSPKVFPVEAVDWLVEHPQQGNMFNNFTWGGYLLYRLWPDATVFIDGQTDFYGEPLTREYSRVITLEKGWEDILNKYNVSWVIVQPNLSLVKVLQHENGWNVLYQDDTAVILRKP